MLAQQSIRIGLIVCLLGLYGCFGGGNYAPVIERKQRLAVIPKTHSVSRGETLYSIAWLYKLDVQGLAVTNGISEPYTIYPKQVIRLDDRVSAGSSKVAARPVSPVKRPATAPSRPTVSTGSASSVSQPSVVQNDRASVYPFRWQWPASNSLLRSYSSVSAVHKGIDIQGNFGEPVHAANSGRVVYAGSGLVGYGKLLIIKHNEKYLSAYGHNSKLLVKEGAMVKVGEKIAEFGDSGTDKVKLHFEIRRNGQPVNPLSLLPKG